MSDVWNSVYAKDMAFFGDEPSAFALSCYDFMKKNNVKKILEIGCGQGRDCLFFASNGIEVVALDYSKVAIDSLLEHAKQKNLSVDAHVYDAKKPLPFDSGSFDTVYSHMFLNMRFSMDALKFILSEVKKVLKDNGLHFFSVRNHNDKFFAKGTKVEDDIYDINGFQIRFFTRQEIEDLLTGFKILEIKEGYEDAVTLYHVSARKC